MADGTIKILTDLSTEGFQKGLSGLGNLAKSGLAAVSGAVTVAGTAIAGLGVAATKVGIGFESSMAKASTLFGDVEVDTQKLNKNVLTLSSSTGLAADTIGNSLYNALSAGIPVSEDMGEAMDYMKKNADLSRAGFTDIDTAVTATAKVLNAYKMDVNETDRVHKILMATQNKGITTVGELGAVLAQVTPTAAAMNVSFEQVGAALATMTAQGTPTAQATTQLNSLFAELGKQGTIANKSLVAATEGTKYAGMGFQDLMAAGVPLNEVLDLMGVSADMSDQSLLDMFGSLEAGKAALAMSSKNSEQFTTNLSAMSTSADLVGDAVAKMDDTLQVRSQKMMESMKNLGITIYDSLESPLKSAVDLGIGYIGELNEAFSTGLDSGIEAIGKVFADIAVKAADMAPQMIDAGAKLLLAFCNGLEKNSKKITQAAVKIGTALVSSLVKLVPQIGKIGLKIITEFSKELFGYNIGSKVEKLGKSIGDAFGKMSQAVLIALDKLGPAMSKVADAFLSAATGAITILGDSISFLVENCDILLPVLAGVAAGMTAWAIVNTVSQGMAAAATAITAFTAAVSAEGIAHAASTVAITAKQVAVGVLSGQIGLVTAAQWLWNTAMSANPIGIVITAVAALGVGIAALCLTQEQELSGEEQLSNANRDLAGTYSEVLSGVNDYKDGVASAKGVLDALNQSTGLTSEKQQELAAEMDSVQQQINAICSTASTERRQLTTEEITSLEELIQKQTEIAQREVELYTSRGESVQTYAAQIASSTQYTAAEFEAEAQSVAKSAQDSYDQRTNYANEYMIQQLAELEQQKQVTSMTTSEYNSRKETIIAAYQAEKESAQTQMDATNAILADGYANRATEARKWSETSYQYAQAEATANKAHAEELKQIDATIEKNTAERHLVTEDAEEQNKKTIANIRNQKNAHLKNISAEEISTLLGMVEAAGGAYDNLNDDTKQMVGQFLVDLSELPPESRTEMEETLAGMNMAISAGGELMKVNADGSMTKFITGFTSREKDAVQAMRNTTSSMNNVSKNKTFDAGKMGEIQNAIGSVSNANRAMQSHLNSNPLYQSVYKVTYESVLRRTGGAQEVGHAKGGVNHYAKGGVTKHASGGVSPKISKHAAGVFTKRTRLWDPVTGINEYGEAGHEALLPLKESVFNEIAKGIVRQLSPAKLSGILSQMRAAVQAEAGSISVQMTANADYQASSKNSEQQKGMDKLFAKLDALGDKLERLAGLTVALDGTAVGKLLTPTINQNLGNLAALEERGKF